MSLIKTIAEVQEHIAIEASSDLDNMMPDIREVEEDYIAQALGKETYDSLDAEYNAETPALEEQETKLLKLCQAAICNLAQAKYIIVNRVSFSNSGIRIVEDSIYKTAYKYMFDELIEHFEKRGFNYIDKLLAYLESEKDYFTDWAEDESAYTINKKHFIRTADEFDKHYRIGKSRRTFMALEPVMQQVEDFFIEYAITEELSARLKEEIRSGDALSEGTQNLIEKIQPAVAHFTIGHAIDLLSFEVTESGLLVREYIDPNAKKSSPPVAQMEVKRNAAFTSGNRYLDRLKDFLNKTASEEVYPEYFESNLYISPTIVKGGRDQRSSKFYGT